MRKNKSKILNIAMAVVLGLSLMVPASAAPTIKDAQDKKEELEEQLGDVEEQVEALKEKSASTQEYLNQLDKQLAELSNQLVAVEQDLTASEKELAATQVALEEARVKKDRQYEDMKKRIKFMYENGDTAYLEMILQAKDFTDMLNKADYVKAISEYDRNMLTEFQNTVDDIAVKEAEIQQKCIQIEQLKASVEEQKASVESVTSTKKQEMENYKKEIAASEELKEEYEAELDAQDELIAQLEAEAARKAAEEAKKKAAQQSGNKTGTTANSSTSSSASVGGWVWPCPGYKRISSDYGYRDHPTLGEWKKHNGIDVAAPTGATIVSAASGKVIAASYSSSMGNYVIIDHGGGVSTVYMHCSALACSAGDSVNAGDTIAYVGSTGRSTGPHLHFSVRLNSVYVNPWDYVSK